MKPCKVWTKATNKRGYGVTYQNGKTILVHRLAWMEHFGEPPPDKPFVLHRCDNPPCYEVTHLWCGDHADNTADRVAKGRPGHPPHTHCNRGHELTPENRYTSSGNSCCRTCRNDAQRRRRAGG